MSEQRSMRRRIERWRSEQPAYTRMPEELWEVAVSLARKDGAYAVARDLGLSYATLKRRVEESCVSHTVALPTRVGMDFIELRGAEVLSASEQVGVGSVVELVRVDGTRLTLRLPAGEKLDVAAMTGAFLHRA